MKIMQVAAAFAAASLLTCNAAAAGEAANWYFRKNTAHKQPQLDACQKIVEKYGAVTADRAHGDNSAEKVIYLTFDAGYENGNVAKILDTLKEENVPAAFFVLENLIRRNPELICRMADEGHLICNHTMKHRDMTGCTFEQFKAELEGLEKLCFETTGKTISKYYRPPEGRYSESNLEYARRLGYTTVFWSFAYADWDNAKQPQPSDAEKKILDNIHNGAVILLHPTSAANAAVLGDVIRKLKGEGYTFGTLEQIEKKEN